MEIAKSHLNHSYQKGFDKLEKEHVEAYIKRWNVADQSVNTDLAKQMKLRFDQFRKFQKFPFKEAIPIEGELPDWLL